MLRNLPCLTTHSSVVGTRLRTTRLQTVPHTVCLSARASPMFDSFTLKYNKRSFRREASFVGMLDRSRTCDNPASEAGALSTELQAHIL